MNILIEKQLNEFLSTKIISKRKILSKSFGIVCEKIELDNKEIFVAKYYEKINKGFNSIKSEGNTLDYLSKKNFGIFPKIQFFSEDLLIIDYIEHNNIKNENYQNLLCEKLLTLHNINNDKYGFKFDTQIGGLRQKNNYEMDWISFFGEKRLNMIYEKICQNNPMPYNINHKIEYLIKNLNNFLPQNPKKSLLHGDLWEGNILFKDGKLVGLIDPGIYFGHNEMEIAYLTWFNYVNANFLEIYSNSCKIDKYFYKYEPIYQLYFSLLNVHLWDRIYINDTGKLLEKILQTHGLGSDK